MNSAGCSNRRGSRFAAPFKHHDCRAGRDVDTADRRRHTGEPEVALDRALDAQRLLDEVRDAGAVFAQRGLKIGALTDELQRRAEQSHGRLLAGGEQIGSDPDDIDDLRCRAVGERGGRKPGHDIVARRASPILDVRGELAVEELERAVLQRVVSGAADGTGLSPTACESLAEELVVLFGHAEQVGDDQHGERLREVADELALAGLDELVELTIGEAPHELLVLLEALRRDQSHQQRAMRGVLRRVERRQLVAERQLVAILLDEFADVVAFQRHRESREGPRDRIARRKCCSVVEDLHRLVVAGHHDDAVVRFALQRALRAQGFEIRIRVGDYRVVAEEVDRVEVGHSTPPETLCSMISSYSEPSSTGHSAAGSLNAIARLAHAQNDAPSKPPRLASGPRAPCPEPRT